MAETTTTGTDPEPYSGVLGAFPYAFRASDSRLCRSYVVAGTLLGGLVTVGFLLAFVTLMGEIAGTPAGIFTFQPALYILAWLFSVAPLLGPVVLVARQHRRGAGDARYDRALAAAGFLSILLLYAGLVTSVPPEQQQPVSGVLAPLVGVLYALPQLAGLVPAGLALALVGGLHLLLRE